MTNGLSSREMSTALVIGGGIGGLCTAIALQQIGIQVQVFEQAAAVRDLGAGLAIWPNALKALDQLGLGDRVRALAVADANAGSILTWQGHRLLTTSVREMVANFGESVQIVHRADLHALLTQALQPGTLRLSSHCVGFSQTAQEVTVRFEDMTTASASMLIAADGLHSTVRQQIVPESYVRYSGYTAWRSVVEFDHHRVPHWGEFWGPGRRFGVAPVHGNRVYWFCTENVTEGESRKASAEQRKAHLLSIFGKWADPIPALLAETDASMILSNDISDLAPLTRWTEGRVALLGDAAHAMTPNMGQGACQAMEDAVVLAHCLRKNTDVPAALKVYEQARILHTRQIASMSRTIGTVGQWENPLACSVRNFAIHLMPYSMRMNSLRSMLEFSL